jgi:hypothetical protein
MSFCVASYFTCSPRASSASATSASSPTEGAPPCCHGASPLFTPLHRKTNRKRRPLLQRTRCGAAPSAADQWLSSNDSPRHNSNFVLHRSWSQLHEITCPQPQLLARFSAPRRSVSPSPLDTFSMPQSRFRFKRHFTLAHARRLLCHRPRPPPPLLQTSLAPFNLHKYRAHRASGFLLTAFSNATPHAFFQPWALILASRPKKH